MASTYWRTGHTVASVLPQMENGWNFLQLVRLLLSLDDRYDGISDSELLDDLAKKVSFKGSLAADFPPGEIRHVNYKDGHGPSEVTTIDGALTCTDGPLPEPFVAWIKDAEERGDHAMADFLNLFSNRLLALRYLVARTMRPALMDTSINKSDTGKLLTALTGIEPGSKPQGRWNPEWDLGTAGLFANRRLSLPVVRHLLKFSMGLQLIRMNSLVGGWLNVDSQDHTRLGAKQATRLGQGATLGNQVWDQQKAIELVIGPVKWKEIKALVPGGARYEDLKALLFRITDRRCDCRITFVWPRDQVPKPRLGHGARFGSGVLALGHTATLARQPKGTGSKEPLSVSFMVNTSA